MDFAWDSHNPTKRRLALVRMRFGIRTAYVMAFVLLAAGLALSAYLGIGALIAASAGAFLGFAYSHPLTRLKEHPPLNFISGGLCYGILPVLLGWSLVASLTWPSLFAGIPSVIVISSGYILIGLPDIPNRRSPRAGTLPATFDHRRAVMTSMLLVGVAGAITAVFVLVGWYPSATLLVVPVLVSIMAMHYRLLDPGIAESSFLQLRYLYVVLGMIFLTSLAM
jgi:4-hydroxybenzoate polyprenyltransferase